MGHSRGHPDKTHSKRSPSSSESSSALYKDHFVEEQTCSEDITPTYFTYGTCDAGSSFDINYIYNSPFDNNTIFHTVSQSINVPYHNTTSQHNTESAYTSKYGQNSPSPYASTHQSDHLTSLEYSSPQTVPSCVTDRAGGTYVQDGISTFVRGFEENRMQYLKLEQEIGFRVKQKLNENNVEYLWQSRAKDPHSLETKLRGRKHKYSNDQANCAAIKDLIGCRIVLPRLTSDLPTVKALIQSYFNFLGEKSHPEQGSTGGYVGFHFYVAMKQHGSQDVRIEIQVMSPSQYNYAFYDHDILYKQSQGQVTIDDITNLSNLRAAAYIADVASENLQNRTIEW